MQKIIFHGSFLKLRTINKNILELAFDSEKQPINIFNEVTIDELSIVLSIVENQSNINGLIFTSTKRDFVVGADIHELRQIFEKSDSYLKAFFL
jgi:3-hydroxyacyl-CoA dehydrogenase/enoyl-CoA hydratase/3-hydroxybutyryl-CoA epimerase/enoyl-CoA isomerase